MIFSTVLKIYLINYSKSRFQAMNTVIKYDKKNEYLACHIEDLI